MAIRRNNLRGTPGETVTAANMVPSGDPFDFIAGGSAVYIDGGGMELALGSGQTYGAATDDQAGTRFVCATLAPCPSGHTAETGVLSMTSGGTSRTRILVPTNYRPRIASGSTGVTATQMPDPLTPGELYLWELAYTPDPGGGTGVIQYRVSQPDGTLIFECPAQTHSMIGSPAYRFGTAQTTHGLTTQKIRDAQWGPLESGWIGPYPPPANEPPVANAGPDQLVEAGQQVTLTLTGTDPDGTITAASWEQTSGPTVDLDGTGAVRTFRAPISLTDTALGFRGTVTDDDGATGSDTMQVTVLAAPLRMKTAGGLVPVVRHRKT
ncbi:hypothetical protein DT076_16510 [Desertihabitans brevis]|uniref:PKD domain-containing protein n=1 Tax=Desertihabitans brevis TaxID=2268447 RepID=A0A367YTE2_9ACTN|nr:hypothetical protein [Desertihabitans brevis]RCK68251.1 hypothetical protein DT076_16510 [Desertihabitans brevis]